MNRKIIGGILLLALLAGTVGYYLFIYESTPQENLPYQEAQEALDNRSYSQALAKYKEAINIDPTLTDAYLQAGEILFLKNKPTEAIEILQTGIGFADNEADIHQEIAHIYATQMDFEKALEYSTNALNISQATTYRADQIGYLALLERFDEAKTEASNVSGNDAYSNFIKSIVNYADLENAREHARKASEQDNDLKYKQMYEILKDLEESEESLIENYMHIAKVAIENDEEATALIIMSDIKQENEFYEGAYIYEAYVHMSFNNLDKAIELLKAAQVFSPNNSDIPKLLAECYFKKHDLENASKNMQKALSFADVPENTYFLSYQIYAGAGEHEKALEVIDKLVGIDSTNYEYTIEKSEKLITLEKYSEAIEFLEGFLEQNQELSSEEEATLISIKAYAIYMTGDKKLAKDLLEEAEILFETSPRVNYYYGLFYAGQEDVQTAQEYFDTAIDHDIEGLVTAMAKLAEVELELENIIKN